MTTTPPQHQSPPSPSSPSSTSSTIKPSLPIILCATLSTLVTWFVLIVFLPFISSWGWHVESSADNTLRKQSCSCDCWDGRFKGAYGRSSPITHSEYQFIYFNMEKETWYLFSWVALYLIAGLKCFERLFRLMFGARCHWPSVLTFITCLYPVWHDMWAHFHLMNDKYQRFPLLSSSSAPSPWYRWPLPDHQHVPQSIFTLSHVFVCLVVVYLLDRQTVDHVKQQQQQPQTALTHHHNHRSTTLPSSSLSSTVKSSWYLWTCLYISLTHIMYSVRRKDQLRLVFGTGVYQMTRLHNTVLLLCHVSCCILILSVLGVTHHFRHSELALRSIMKKLIGVMVLSGFSALVLHRITSSY